MAQDCYSLFKQVYNQAVADGLSTTVAASAAAAAQADCLSQQSRAAGVDFVTAVPGTRLTDPGPKSGEGLTNNVSRGAKLGQKSK